VQTIFLKRFYKVCVVFSARFHTSLPRARAFFYVFLQDQNECFSFVKVLRSWEIFKGGGLYIFRSKI